MWVLRNLHDILKSGDCSRGRDKSHLPTLAFDQLIEEGGTKSPVSELVQRQRHAQQTSKLPMNRMISGAQLQEMEGVVLYRKCIYYIGL